MQIKKLELCGFRNYRRLLMEFPRSLNVFVGQNAQGKTNLLEAIYLLAVGRSYRSSREVDLIGWETSFARIRAEVERELGNLRLEVLLKREGSKEMKVSGEPLKRQSDLLGKVNVVVFSPDDLQLVKGSPSLRRRFLDLEIAQVSPSYRYHFTRYQRVLRQRNNLLKAVQGGQAGSESLEAWNLQLVACGTRIVTERAETVRRLGLWSGQMQARISSGKEELNLVYRPFFCTEDEMPHALWEDVGAVDERFRHALQEVRKEELIRGVTLVGPQRDDIAFLVDNVDLRYFGSQGQQRTAVLSCKLAELEFIKEEAGEYPVLLLDDVLSELDDGRREEFMNTVTGRVNTFITTTNLRGLSRDVLDQSSRYEISSGAVIPLDER